MILGRLGVLNEFSICETTVGLSGHNPIVSLRASLLDHLLQEPPDHLPF